MDNTAAHKMERQLASEQFRPGRGCWPEGVVPRGWLYFPQLPELADFAKAVPDLTIILNHIGGLMRVGPYANRDAEVLATWRSGIAAVAKCPNVYMKLGGLGMPRTGFDWHTRSKPIGSEELAASMAPWLTYCIEQFGPNRCMFESNFPVDKVSFSYNVMYNAFKRLSKGYSAAERAAMFHDTAARVYRIDADAAESCVREHSSTEARAAQVHRPSTTRFRVRWTGIRTTVPHRMGRAAVAEGSSTTLI